MGVLRERALAAQSAQREAEEAAQQQREEMLVAAAQRTAERTLDVITAPEDWQVLPSTIKGLYACTTLEGVALVVQEGENRTLFGKDADGRLQHVVGLADFAALLPMEVAQ